MDEDTAACAAALRAGSQSFALAGRLLPAPMFAGAASLYAFCREADDAIDDATSPAAARAAHGQLVARLDAVVRAPGTATLTNPVDRALWRTLQRHALDARPLYALLEGLLWDAEGKVYERLADTLDYAARVAGGIGVLMARLAGVADAHVLARAADMGTAMQLTNIARDVGEDARRARLYLPAQWLRQRGLEPAAFLAAPTPHPAIRAANERLLRVAAACYARARHGLYALPRPVRLGLAAAGRIYEDIGRSVQLRGYDSVGGRAVVSTPRKLVLICLAWAVDGWRPRRPQARAKLSRPPLLANRFLLVPHASVVADSTARGPHAA